MIVATELQISKRPVIALWLLAVCGLIALMVVVGGLTRLTDSGLSITSWKPIHGALPPLSEAEWQEEFSAYQQIPQYQQLNRGMTLEEFKEIFWWEWSHRNLGRLIGLAYFVPLVFFLVRGWVEPRLRWPLFGLFILGGLQGVLGWFMVASGLTERVSVSQYRLVAHLTLALVIYAALLWTALPLRRGEWPAPHRPHRLYGMALGLIGLTFLQIMLGGFVAGLDAGLIYNTWPLMDGAFIPEGAYRNWLSPFEGVTTAQFNHRMFAYLLFAGVCVQWFALYRCGVGGEARLSATWLLGLVVLQGVLGIWTLLEVVPIWLGALHQAGAVAVLTASVWHARVMERSG